MPFTFIGDQQLTYTQYLDGDGSPLTAEPGGTYDGIRPAGGLNLPVPPPDGNWEDADPSPPPARAARSAASASPAAAPSSEGN